MGMGWDVGILKFYPHFLLFVGVCVVWGRRFCTWVSVEVCLGTLP